LVPSPVHGKNSHVRHPDTHLCISPTVTFEAVVPSSAVPWPSTFQPTNLA
jgi:hypothetical protein